MNIFYRLTCLTRPVQYVKANMARSYRLTCLKSGGKIIAAMPNFWAISVYDPVFW